MEKKQGNIVAIITMIFLFGMISFVTNLAAPIGVIWKQAPGIEGSNALGMMGNMMNFLAYLFMGIPAGKMLQRIGYKRTALVAIAIGFIGVFTQFLSGIVGVNARIFGLPANWYVYLLGAFIAGFSVCMLNTVVNPMLTLLGGGGKRGNQYIQIGGTFNSLMATLTPMLVGALIGSVSKDTVIADVNPVLFMAMGVFALAFIILLFIPISNPETEAAARDAVSPWKYRHFVFGVIAIFVYVGIEAASRHLELLPGGRLCEGSGLGSRYRRHRRRFCGGNILVPDAYRKIRVQLHQRNRVQQDAAYRCG